MRLLLLSCILSIVSASAQGSVVDEKPLVPQAGQKIAPVAEGKDGGVSVKKPAAEKAGANDSAPNSLLNVNPETKDERDLHDSLMTQVRALGVGTGNAEHETPTEDSDLGQSIWEDFKLPLIIIGGLLVYFLPTFLSLKRNDFKKVFHINLLLGCTVAAGLILFYVWKFPAQWLYGWAAVSWVIALARLFLKDCAQPPERQRRRRNQARTRN